MYSEGIAKILFALGLLLSPVGVGAEPSLSESCQAVLRSAVRGVLRDVRAKGGEQERDVRAWLEVFQKGLTAPEEGTPYLWLASRLGEFPAERVEAFLRATAQLPSQARLGVVLRARTHARAGDEKGLRALVHTVIDSARFTDALPKTTPGLDANIKTAVDKALVDFRANPKPLLNHVTGRIVYEGTRAQRHVISHGVHTVLGYERLMDQRLLDWRKSSPEAKQSYDQMRKRIDAMDLSSPENIADHVKWRLEAMKDQGFDTSRDGLFRFWLGGDRLGVGVRSNGVVFIRNHRSMFRTQAWEQTVGAAMEDFGPAGGKTLFPASWDEAKIRSAIEVVLGHPDSEVFQVKGSDGGLRFYLKNWVDGVEVAVGLGNGKANTAFPTWFQERPRPIAQMYSRYAEDLQRVEDRLRTLHQAFPLPPGFGLKEVRAIYLGENPGLVPELYEKLADVLDPARWDAFAEPRVGNYYSGFPSSVQSALFEWLYVEGQLRGIEGQYPLTPQSPR